MIENNMKKSPVGPFIVAGHFTGNIIIFMDSLEGSLSQNSNLGPSFNFIKCRN